MNRYLRTKLLDQGLVRPFVAADALAVTDLLFKTYGYTYRGRSRGTYDPDEISVLHAKGLMRGHVLVGADGRVQAYMATKPRGEGGLEVCEVVVDPDLRNLDAARRLGEATWADARAQGARKIVVETVTFHPFAQKTNARFELTPCYLSLAEHPHPLVFRGIGGERTVQRESFVVMEGLLEKRRLPVALPPRHAALCRRIYAALGVERDEVGPGTERPGDTAQPLAARAELDVELREAWQAGRIRVLAPGADAFEAVMRVADDFRRGFLEHVEVRVPLDTPHGAALATSLEDAGFVFVGLDPDESGRDEAVLDLLPGPSRLDPKKIHLVHELARALGEEAAKRLPPAEASAPRLPAPAPAPQGPAEVHAGVTAARPAFGEMPSSASAPAARPEKPSPPAAPAPVPAPAPAPVPLAMPIPPLEMIEFARLAGQKQLVSGLAHEINNPLNIILGSAYVLKSRAREGKADGEELVRRLTSIEEEVARVAKVIENLRRFSHPEETPRARIELKEPLDVAASLLRGEAGERAIEVRVAVPQDLPAVRANAAEIEQAVYQLVRNAVEASKDGAVVEVAARAEGESVRIHVRDRGRGIAPEDLRRAFDPFFTTKESGVGAGLGLSIARAIVEAHGGKVRLESRLGEGTLAEVELPVAREGAAGREPRAGSGLSRAVTRIP